MEKKQAKSNRRPEIAIAREYYLVSQRLKAMLENSRKYKLPTSVMQDEMKKWVKLQDELETEMEESYIEPNLKNKNIRNIMVGFVALQKGWTEYFNSMSDEVYNQLERLEAIYRKDGTCPAYEKIKCPNRFKYNLPDLTMEEWTDKELFNEPIKLTKVIGHNPAAVKKSKENCFAISEK